MIKVYTYKIHTSDPVIFVTCLVTLQCQWFKFLDDLTVKGAKAPR